MAVYLPKMGLPDPQMGPGTHSSFSKILKKGSMAQIFFERPPKW